jgi:hypothetical protein
MSVMLVSMAKRKNPAAVALGRLGGKAGKGKSGIQKGLAAMSPEQREEIRAKALAARRAKRPQK